MMLTKKCHRLAAAAVLTAATAVGLPVSARADAPQPVAGGTSDLPAGVACVFPVRISATDGLQGMKQFYDRSGNLVRIFGFGTGISYTFTNLTNEKSITIKARASASQTVVDENGVQTITASGQYGLIMFPTDVPAGPSTTFYVGRLVYTVDSSNVTRLVSNSGQSVDVCAALS
jgi:hypothetical protein